MEKVKVLITGAGGFIGQNLFYVLSQKDDLEIYGTWHGKLTHTLAHYLDGVDLMKKGDAIRVTKDIDVVIHGAAVSAGAKYIVKDPGFLLDNAIINTNILEAAHQNKVKHFIFLSCSVLYPMDLGRPVAEGDLDYNRIHPKYHAGAWVKIYGEKLCEFYSKLGHMRFTVIRHSNIYGPYDKFDLDRSHVLGATIAKVMQAKNGDDITVWGDGRGKRDFLFVSDFTRFVEAILNADWRYQTFNVGSGSAVSVNDLTAKIIALSGKKLIAKHDATKPSIGGVDLALNIDKARNIAGWEPEVGLDSGISQTIAWYRENYQEIAS